MSGIKEKIEARLDELGVLLKNEKYTEAEELLPSITKFTSVLTEEQRDFLGAVKHAVAENLDWTKNRMIKSEGFDNSYLDAK